MTLWVLQAFVFRRGMEAIRVFVAWAGPAVYGVMIALAAYLVAKAGIGQIGLTLGTIKYTGWDALPMMINAIALVFSYFSSPMLNFGDFSRYVSIFEAVKRGNFWGLPVNFPAFSLLTVVIASATVPVFGHLITDPVETVSRIDSTFAVVLGAFIGPLFGTLVGDFYLVKKQRVVVDDLYTLGPAGTYWHRGGCTRAAAGALIPSALIPVLCVLLQGLESMANFTWFIGCALVFVIYALIMRHRAALVSRPA